MEVSTYEIVPGTSFPPDRTAIYFFLDQETEIDASVQAQLLGKLGEALVQGGQSDLVPCLKGDFLRSQPLRGGNFLVAFRCCQSLTMDGTSLSSILVDVAAK